MEQSRVNYIQHTPAWQKKKKKEEEVEDSRTASSKQCVCSRSSPKSACEPGIVFSVYLKDLFQNNTVTSTKRTHLGRLDTGVTLVIVLHSH